MNSKINELISEVEDIFTTADKAHDFYHTQRVFNISISLLKNIDANHEVTKLVALLHDVDDKKIRKANFNSQAKFLLDKYKYPEKTQTSVLLAISEISFSANLPTSSIEAKIVQDADRLDALGAIGVARTFTYGGSKGIPIYDLNNYSSITHFYDKLLKLADTMNFSITKKEADKRTAFLKVFLEQFYNDISNDFLNDPN